MEELDKDAKDRFDAFGDQVKDVAEAARTGDAQGFDAAVAAMGQLAKQVDAKAVIDALHVPKEAGEWEAGLRRILARIPDGWGRWISCGQGWYPIIVALDQELAKLDPGYTVEQVKEKYATLRYYYSLSPVDVQDPADPEPAFPGRSERSGKWGSWDNPEEVAAWEEEVAQWEERLVDYKRRPEVQAVIAAAKERQERADALVREAEEEAARTCERCGRPGSQMQTLAPSPWYSTVCVEHGAGLVTHAEWEAWWAEYEPTWREETRTRQRALYAGKRILVACTDERLALAVEATYARTPAEVEALLELEWDKVFFADDAAGAAVQTILAARYAAQAERQLEELKAEHGYNARARLFMRDAPETCMVGYFQGVGALLDVGIRVSSGFDYLYADEEAYQAYRAAQSERELTRRAKKAG